ncbi:MAG: protein adenylyltransferase SelO family protein, partial [Paracraurococcus sp.]
YIVSEAMAALGVPTTRALAAVLTGEAVRRETLLPGAILARVAASHIRIGTFQFFAARRDAEALRLLADHVIARHYPEVAGREAPHLALLEAVVAAQADLVARWMLIGFIHGVMNTDNMSIAGETIDYGPCAFMDAYDPKAVFSSIDSFGRYAYANQPRIAQWNLARLAETLLPLLAETEEAAVEVAQAALGDFATRFEALHRAGLLRKIGLTGDDPTDLELVQALLQRMAEAGADFSLTFRRLCDAAAGPEGDAALRALFSDPAAYDSWAPAWRARLAAQSGGPQDRAAAMRATNPAVIPRNHQVEAVIAAAVERGDLAPFEALLAATARPFEERAGIEPFMLPPREEERVLQTFCGT